MNYDDSNDEIGKCFIEEICCGRSCEEGLSRVQRKMMFFKYHYTGLMEETEYIVFLLQTIRGSK